jgi:hypothetical protein
MPRTPRSWPIARSWGRGMYFAKLSIKGPVKYRDADVAGSIGVLEAPDNPMPISMASCKTWDERGLAVWELTIGGQQLEGR